MSCFNTEITSLQLSDTFNTWFQRTNQIISTINSIQIAGISVYDHPTNHYFGQKIEKINGSCYLTSEIITGPFINFQTGNPSHYGSGTSADPWKITLTFPNDSAFLADRQMTGNDELIINDSVSTGIPVKRIKAKDIVPSTIDVSYLRIQNRDSQAQGSTFAFYADSSPYNTWSGISASNFSAERLQGFVPSTTAPSNQLGTYRQVIPVTDSSTGLIPDDFVRMPMIFRVGSQLVSGFDATADVKSFNISVSSRGSTAPGGEGGLLIQATTGTDGNSSVPNAVSYNIEALIPATGNSGPYGVNLFNINGYSVLHSAMSADSRSRLSAHMGLSGGKGISTNLVARGITVNYIIPGDPNNFIQYSGMTAVDIFTIAENPLDSNYVRKIGDIMTGTLTGSSTNFVFGDGEILNTLTADNITNTTLFTGKNLKTTLGYAQFSLDPVGGTFTVNNNNTPTNHILQIVPTNSTVSLNNGDHVFTDDNISLDKDGTGVVQIGYAGPQSGKSFFVNGNSQFDGNMQVYEGLVVDGGITAVNGDVFIHGNVSITGSCLIEGDIETDNANFDNVTVYNTITGKLADFSQTGDNTGIKTYSSNLGENILLANGSSGFVAIGLNENFVDNQNKKLTISGGMSADYAFINSLVANDTETVGLTANLANFNILKTNRASREGNFYIYEQNDPNDQDVLEQILINDGPTFTSFESGSEYITKKYLDAIIPIGTIIPYAGAVTNSPASGLNPNPPRGWHLCDGSVKYPFVNNTTTVWARLYTVIGNTYGSVGSGFRLPDLRGRVIRGGGIQGFANPLDQTGAFTFSTALGVYGGSEKITLTTGQMPRHRHNFLRLSTGRDGDDSAPAKGIVAPTNEYLSQPNGFNTDKHVMNYEGNDESHDNMQPYYNINYLIKYL